MMQWIFLAHGAAGIWDEVAMGGIAIIFTGFLIVGYIKSQQFEPELDDSTDSSPAPSSTD